jgi:hypothetical protein
MIQQPFNFVPAGGIDAAGCSACIAQEHRVGSCARVLPQPLHGDLVDICFATAVVNSTKKAN